MTSARPPSGLFPAGPARPTFREPFPVRPGGLLAGLGAAALWMMFFGLLGVGLRSYALWTILAGVVCWALALVLARFGDRGVAVGIALSTSVAWSAAAIAVAFGWAASGDWPLW